MTGPPEKNAPAGAATQAERYKVNRLRIMYHFLGLLQTPFRLIFWWLQQQRDRFAIRALRLGSDWSEEGEK